MIYKGGASYISAIVLHRPLYPHQLATRSYQHRVHHRLQCTNLSGRRFLLFGIHRSRGGVSSQKAYDACNEHNIRAISAWSRRGPGHRIIPGLQYRWHLFFILASDLKSKRSDHELVYPRLRWRTAL